MITFFGFPGTIIPRIGDPFVACRSWGGPQIEEPNVNLSGLVVGRMRVVIVVDATGYLNGPETLPPSAKLYHGPVSMRTDGGGEDDRVRGLH